MKTTLQTALAAIAPSIVIETIWEHDNNPDRSIFSEGSALHSENIWEWECWQSEVKATAIVNGEYIHGSAYLGGTWEKQGDDPQDSNPSISGYELQITVEALEELGRQTTDLDISGHAITAIRHCNRLMAAESSI